jgi:hypothetical protein
LDAITPEEFYLMENWGSASAAGEGSALAAGVGAATTTAANKPTNTAEKRMMTNMFYSNE